MSRNEVKIMADMTMTDRSTINFNENPEVHIELIEGEWHYTARSEVRSGTPGQRPGGRLAVELKFRRPFDPDLRYTVTVPVDEIQRAMQTFLTLLGETMGDARKAIGDKTGQDGNQTGE